MIRVLIAGALAALIALPVAAQDFSEGSQAKGWKNLQGREPARFKAKVVDILCELTGECVEKCGEGRRQMGLLREADGKLILAGKNNQASFNGATVDLYPYCGQTVTVDGLMVGNPELTDTKYMQVQLIHREGAARPAAAKRWTRVWRRNNKEAAKKKGPWFRHDPAVNAEIERDGYLGISHEADKKFIEEFY